MQTLNIYFGVILYHQTLESMLDKDVDSNVAEMFCA